MFYAVPISMLFVSEIEAVTTAGVFQRVRAVNEKHGIVNVVFLAEISKERVSGYLVNRWSKRCV
jgi:hypothetical protein